MGFALGFCCCLRPFGAGDRAGDRAGEREGDFPERRAFGLSLRYWFDAVWLAMMAYGEVVVRSIWQ
jgi:hypothetical protein